MAQPVKLSDPLVLDARLAGAAFERSIAGQVEYWARLGRSVELLLNGRQSLILTRKGVAPPLSELLSSADSPEGRRRVAGVLDRQPFPHYRPLQGKIGLLERIDANGKRTQGRFVNRKFQAVRVTRKTAAAGR